MGCYLEVVDAGDDLERDGLFDSQDLELVEVEGRQLLDGGLR